LTDTQILDLFGERSESAISQTANHYGAYCLTIAMNILQNREDSEECVNDTYLKAWNSIPPKRPMPLSTYYRFLAELDDAVTNDMKWFGAFYVPAIHSDYWANTPSWSGGIPTLTPGTGIFGGALE
jgi:hypothetical protein